MKQDPKTLARWVETSLEGKALLTIPQLNKSTAFTLEEREAFGLECKLPYRVETIEEQAARCYKQYSRFVTKLEKHIYLGNLRNINETLFFHLVNDNLEEMLPIIYTPTIAEAVEHYSTEYRQARGLYIAYPDRHRIKEFLANRTNAEIKLIVASDAEGVLGIGDQGIGGMEIPIAKLAVYTLCAGINPANYLPIFLDTGTNNQALLDDPFYLGWRHKRLKRKQYDEMMDCFVSAVKSVFPTIFLHWEDFGRDNARRVLTHYQHSICSFNDDMQGTAVVTIAALLAACKARNLSFEHQRMVIFGAGTAGVGIVDAICRVLQYYGLSEAKARSCFWLLDRQGLLIKGGKGLTSFQRPYARTAREVSTWRQNETDSITLETVIHHVKPTTLIGCSTSTGAFNATVLKLMAKYQKQPIIFPLSNPTARAECTPEDIYKHTKGHALLATGSPFPDVHYQGEHYYIAQCNNALAFPGIGLGVIACEATQVTREMLWAACHTLSDLSPARANPKAPLLPKLKQARAVSKYIARAVAAQAIKDGVAKACSPQEVENKINALIWEPEYVPYKRMKR